MRNLKCELKDGFPKTVLTRYVNCLLNMYATSNNNHSSMFHVRLYACNIFLFTFVLLLVNMKVSNLISLFPVIDNPAITRAFLFVYLFIFKLTIYGKTETFSNVTCHQTHCFWKSNHQTVPYFYCFVHP